jgi:hypothetical protein
MKYGIAVPQRPIRICYYHDRYVLFRHALALEGMQTAILGPRETGSRLIIPRSDIVIIMLTFYDHIHRSAVDGFSRGRFRFCSPTLSYWRLAEKHS